MFDWTPDSHYVFNRYVLSKSSRIGSPKIVLQRINRPKNKKSLIKFEYKWDAYMGHDEQLKGVSISPTFARVDRHPFLLSNRHSTCIQGEGYEHDHANKRIQCPLIGIWQGLVSRVGRNKGD